MVGYLKVDLDLVRGRAASEGAARLRDLLRGSDQQRLGITLAAAALLFTCLV